MTKTTMPADATGTENSSNDATACLRDARRLIVKIGSALLVDETKDAATPYSGSRYLRSIAPRSRLVAVVGGTNHAVTPSGLACTDNRIFRYLATGKLPARKAGAGADVRCRKPAAPQPSGPSFAAPSSAPTFASAARAGDPTAGRALIASLLLQAARP